MTNLASPVESLEDFWHILIGYWFGTVTTGFVPHFPLQNHFEIVDVSLGNCLPMKLYFSPKTGYYISPKDIGIELVINFLTSKFVFSNRFCEMQGILLCLKPNYIGTIENQLFHLMINHVLFCPKCKFAKFSGISSKIRREPVRQAFPKILVIDFRTDLWQSSSNDFPFFFFCF